MRTLPFVASDLTTLAFEISRSPLLFSDQRKPKVKGEAYISFQDKGFEKVFAEENRLDKTENKKNKNGDEADDDQRRGGG